MSNSSDGGKAAEDKRLPAVLGAIADELARTGSDLARLGELLSRNLSDPEALRKSYDFQAFDALSQAVAAQARLLRRLSECESGGFAENFAAMVEDIPFSYTRQRMIAAANGVTEAVIPDEADDAEVSWF
jgi:hypothetical protein